MKGKSNNKKTGKNAAVKVTGKEEEFIRLSHLLRGDLNYANWHFMTWKCLWNNIEGYSEEMNVAHTFFTLSMRGHLLETLMHLNKMFDEGKDGTASIFYLLDFADKNMYIFAAPAADSRKRSEDEMILEKQIEEVKPLQLTPDVIKKHQAKLKELPLKKLKKWEEEALAHVDRKVAKKHINVFDECPVDIDEIDRTIDTVHEILNVYSIAYDGQNWDKDLVFTHGIKNMLDAIRASKAAKK
jgi:hypothetical protein